MFLTAKITFIYLLGLAALCVCRRTTASVRYLICAFSLAAVMLALAGGYIPAPSFVPDVFKIVVHSRINSAWGTHSFFDWLPAIWLAGAVLVLVRFLLGIIYLYQQTSNGRGIETESRVEICLAPVSTPLVWGWLHPVILLPLNSIEWPEERRRMAILHEQAHIERRDHWNLLLPLAAQSLYWFHPLTWWLSAKFYEQQELACDDCVLGSGVSPARYAEFLLELSQQNSSRLLFNCAMVGKSQTLRGRIMNILNFKSGQRLSSSKRTALFLAPALLMAAVAFLPTGRGFFLRGATNNQSIYKIGGDVHPPTLISKLEPQYTPEAHQKKIQGVTMLTLVIDAAGNPTDVRVMKSLDSGLDQKAIEAVYQWQFQPATRNGEPVAVQATIEVQFRLV